MMPRPVAQPARKKTQGSVVDALIDKLAIASFGSTTLEETEAPPAAPALPAELWTATALEDGETTADRSLFAYGGVMHPHPTSDGQLACVAVGDIVGKSVEEVQHEADTEWLDVGFETRSGWVVRHEGGDNVWCRME